MEKNTGYGVYGFIFGGLTGTKNFARVAEIIYKEVGGEIILKEDYDAGEGLGHVFMARNEKEMEEMMPDLMKAEPYVAELTNWKYDGGLLEITMYPSDEDGCEVHLTVVSGGSDRAEKIGRELISAVRKVIPREG